jgi:Tfp pilus assembly protein PilF
MKYVIVFSQILVFAFSVLALSPSDGQISKTGSSVLINGIEGTVYDPNRRPVPSLWVELLNEFNMSYARIQTGASGRFTFTGLKAGHYVIKVNTVGTPFEEQTEAVDIVNIFQNSTETVYQDVNLHYRKGMGLTGIKQMTETLFAQEVPEEAKHLYKNGVKDLGNNELQKGRDELEQAIKIFPDYYDALNALGCNYVEMQEYQKSFPYLIRSIDINQRSFTSYYSLAYAAYKIERMPEASEAARASVILQPNSINAQLLYGTILRRTGKLDGAMTSLLKAEQLSKDSPVAEVHWQLGLLYNKLNRNKEAADELETYLKINPDVANKKQIQELIQKLRTKTA